MKNNSDISVRISKLIENLGSNPNQFAKKLGYPRSQTIYDIINGKAQPSFDFFSKLMYSEYSEMVDVNWLLTGRFSKVVSVDRSSLTNSNKGIPYYETLLATAGDFISLLNDAVPRLYYNIPQFDDCKALIPVYGHSMKGIVDPGDLIAIAEINNRDEFNPQRPYLVITEDNRMIKYLKEDETDSSIIWAESTNHARIKLHVENIKKIYAIKGIVRIY